MFFDHKIDHIPKTKKASNFLKTFVRTTRLELVHPYRNYPLKVACLPISPRAHTFK